MEDKVSYLTEIKSMMHGYGDVSNPLPQSVHLVQEILHQQMNSILLQASRNASFRKSNNISHEDILFLMRKDKVKLCRMLKYFRLKDMKSQLMRNTNVMESAGGSSEVHCNMKRMDRCMDFLNMIDHTGDLSDVLEADILDENKQQRDIRQEYMSIVLSKDQYFAFAEARQASFLFRKKSKFIQWLYKDKVTDKQPTEFAVEMLSYLAHETVAQMVDLAMLVRQDSKSDPLERLQPPFLCTTDYPTVQLSLLEDTTTQAAPSTSEADSVSDELVESLFEPKSKMAKLDLDESNSPFLKQQDSSLETSLKTQKKDKTKTAPDFSYFAIKPSEIREAIRRYFQPGGPFICFSKPCTVDVKKFLLCN